MDFKRFKIKAKKEKKIIAFVAVLLLVSLFIYLAPKMGLPFSWDTLFEKSGLVSEAPGISIAATPYDDKLLFIDVGQGDSALMISNGSAALLDCGTPDAADEISDCLKSCGVTKLEFIIVTHAHSDHIGSVCDILNDYTVDTLYTGEHVPEGENDSDIFYDMADTAEKRGTELCVPEDKQKITLGDYILTFYIPLFKTSDENERSLIVLGEFLGSRVLFTGDAGTACEKQLIKGNYSLSADILKVGHHGSKGSSSKDFLKKVKPDYAVISVGESNSYGHPNAEAVKRITDVGAEILRTDEKGTIVFSFFIGGNYELENIKTGQ